LILAGADNAQRAAAIVMMDPDIVSGTEVGLEERGLQIEGFPPGTEKATILIPPTSLDSQGPGRVPFNYVRLLRISPDRIWAVVTDGNSSETGGRLVYYEFDYGLHLRSVIASEQLQFDYAKAYRDGLVHHPFFPNEFDAIKRRVTVRPSPEEVASRAGTDRR